MSTTKWRVDAPARLGAVVTNDDDRIIVAENLSHEDARLIAAAPDLLTALNHVLATTAWYKISTDALASAQAAIAKATESPNTPIV